MKIYVLGQEADRSWEHVDDDSFELVFGDISLEHAVEKGLSESDTVIVASPRAVVAPDIIYFFTWALHEMRDHKDVLAVSAYSCCGPSRRLRADRARKAAVVVEQVPSLVVGLWADRVPLRAGIVNTITPLVTRANLTSVDVEPSPLHWSVVEVY